MSEQKDTSRLEESALWETIVRQLGSDSVTQVAQRHGLPPAAIRAAQRRTGTGLRKTRVVRPELVRPAQPAPEPVPEPAKPAPKTRRAKPERAPAAKRNGTHHPEADSNAASRPVATSPFDSAEPVADGDPVWAWRVHLRGSNEVWFVVAPDLVNAALKAEAAAPAPVERVVRFAPMLG